MDGAIMRPPTRQGGGRHGRTDLHLCEHRLALQKRNYGADGHAPAGGHAAPARGALNHDARVALFCSFENHFKANVSFPESILEVMTNDQYVRGVLDSLHRLTNPAATSIASSYRSIRFQLFLSVA